MGLTQVVPNGEGVSQVSHEDHEELKDNHEELKNCHKTTTNENEQLKDKVVRLEATQNENEELKDKVVRLEAILRVQEGSRPNQPSERHVVEKQTGVRLFK